MTSTELVQKEIRRFLQSAEPEVLRITGDWGVGKTYTWQKILDEAKSPKSIALARYSYASL
jgi:Cdc6-like AAA superfamily ATPase